MPDIFDTDRDRVSHEDDELRGTIVIGPDGEELVYTPLDEEPFSRREYRAMYARAGQRGERFLP